jgi:hypothetical protein
MKKQLRFMLFVSLVVLCFGRIHSSRAVEKTTVASPSSTTEMVVGTIGDYRITGAAFKKRFYQELYPDDYADTPSTEAISSVDCLRLMLAEKAVILEARKQGLTDHENVQSSTQRRSDQLLLRSLGQKVAEEKITVSEDVIDRILIVNPTLDRAKAKIAMQRQKGKRLHTSYGKELAQKLHLEKRPENFSKAAAIHERLLKQPKTPRTSNMTWITLNQIRTELGKNEGSIVLARYNGGAFTVKDLLMALHGMAPTGRPGNLGTPKGIDAFIDKSINKPLQLAEARLRGLDKDAELCSQLCEHEDSTLLSHVRTNKRKEIVEPNEVQIRTYFQTVKDVFRKRDTVEANVIWCENRNAAIEVREALAKGMAFSTAMTELTTDKKDVKPRTLSASSEGFLWEPIWAAEPNQIVGPVIGFKNQQFHWRILQITSKTEGKPSPWDDNLPNSLKHEIMDNLSKASFARYAKEALDKYPHQIFKKRLATFDPRRIP